uniref:Uncharacterized protein n=1 Tax=Anguilla anguilla TaxID=7936 RepID=A0A0E9X0S1_ANGAN
MAKESTRLVLRAFFGCGVKETTNMCSPPGHKFDTTAFVGGARTSCQSLRHLNQSERNIMIRQPHIVVPPVLVFMKLFFHHCRKQNSMSSRLGQQVKSFECQRFKTICTSV